MTTPLYTFLLAVAAVAQLALLCAAAPHIVQRVTSLYRPRTGRLVGLLLVLREQTPLRKVRDIEVPYKIIDQTKTICV